ncbi:MAG TPA: DUF2177 family protein [Candidatus Paceibacterota bacterium]|nr:DUF2177 family protein [Candidatus Paceibacterota bacterium]
MLWAYLLTLPVMAVLDLLWIGVLMKSFYFSRLGFLLSGAIRPIPAVLFYFLFVAGIFYLAVVPAHAVGSLHKALLSAALLGVVAYGTYDLTNMATIAQWPLAVTVIDIAWGAVISALTAAAAYWLLTVFGA